MICSRCNNDACSFGCMKTQRDLLRDELELAWSEMASIDRNRKEYKFKLETLAEEFKLEQARREHLQAILARIHSPAENVWHYEGRGMDEATSLSCPVVMSADTLREMLEARADAINEVAKWISSSMASMLFGSDSWSLRKRVAEVVKSRDWERHLKNEVER